jgi:hypothetical protein
MIVRKLPNHSYEILDKNGHILRRNRHFLKPNFAVKPLIYDNFDETPNVTPTDVPRQVTTNEAVVAPLRSTKCNKGLPPQRYGY